MSGHLSGGGPIVSARDYMITFVIMAAVSLLRVKPSGTSPCRVSPMTKSSGP